MGGTYMKIRGGFFMDGLRKKAFQTHARNGMQQTQARNGMQQTQAWV